MVKGHSWFLDTRTAASCDILCCIIFFCFFHTVLRSTAEKQPITEEVVHLYLVFVQGTKTAKYIDKILLG
jgi:hypothetical protein